MDSYLYRTGQTTSAVAALAINKGQIVKYSAEDKVVPVTATTDIYCGVALEAQDPSGSVTFALRGTGAQVLGKISSGTGDITTGQRLWQASDGTFSTSSVSTTYNVTPAASGSVSITNEPVAYALKAGTASDLLPVFLS